MLGNTLAHEARALERRARRANAARAKQPGDLGKIALRHHVITSAGAAR